MNAFTIEIFPKSVRGGSRSFVNQEGGIRITKNQKFKYVKNGFFYEFSPSSSSPNTVLFSYSDRKKELWNPFSSLLSLEGCKGRRINQQLFNFYGKNLFHIFPVEIVHLIDSYIPKKVKGLIPWVCERLFNVLKGNLKFRFLEMKNNQIRNLFGNRSFRTLVTRPSRQHGKYIKEIKNYSLNKKVCISDFKTLIKKSSKSIPKKRTKANSKKKICDSIFVFTIFIPTVEFGNKFRKIHFVDLKIPERFEHVMRLNMNNRLILEDIHSRLTYQIRKENIVLANLLRSSLKNSNVFISINPFSEKGIRHKSLTSSSSSSSVTVRNNTKKKKKKKRTVHLDKLDFGKIHLQSLPSRTCEEYEENWILQWEDPRMSLGVSYFAEEYIKNNM